MGNFEPWRLPDDVELLPINQRVKTKMLERGIHEEHILEMLYDDRDMVATPVKRGRGKAPAGTRPILLMGNSSRGALEVGVNFDPARKTLWVFHVNMLQDKYRYMYDKLRGQL